MISFLQRLRRMPTKSAHFCLDLDGFPGISNKHANSATLITKYSPLTPPHHRCSFRTHARPRQRKLLTAQEIAGNGSPCWTEWSVSRHGASPRSPPVPRPLPKQNRQFYIINVLITCWLTITFLTTPSVTNAGASFVPRNSIVWCLCLVLLISREQ